MKRLLATCVLVIACTEVTPPERTPTYGFTLDCGVPDVCTSEADSNLRLIFRWPREALPVRIWVEPVGDVPGIVRRGVEGWERAALYGELQARLTGDSTRADIIIRLEEPQSFAPGPNGEAPLDCRGLTDIQIDLDTTIVLPFHTALHPRLGATALEVNACYHTVVAHELGHALGLLLHSSSSSDLMYVRPTVSQPSRGDIATFSALYHTLPTVHLPPGR